MDEAAAKEFSGPLAGVRVIEFAGIGPGPFCAMLLSDMGCDVIRVDRAIGGRAGSTDITGRGRRSVALDLKSAADVETALRLIEKADALIEGFRPGVMERLGIGPDAALRRNPRLVYGRMTGWGQYGPLAEAAGHDINYIALTGALHAIGRAGGGPTPPLNLVGDYGGGALYLAMGICAALFDVQRSGQGQVIDCAMTDGAASLMSIFYGMKASGSWRDERGANMLDGGSHYYASYETRDGKWVAVGSIEPQFYAQLLEKTGLQHDPSFRAQASRPDWPILQEKLAAVFRTKTRDEWCQVMEGADVCFAPVLTLGEAPSHPHNAARSTFVELDGVLQPNVAPRFSRTPSRIQGPPPRPGGDTASVLQDWGVSTFAEP